eukprot:15435095-Alexandrium_andersonii.AAC.1
MKGIAGLPRVGVARHQAMSADVDQNSQMHDVSARAASIYFRRTGCLSHRGGGQQASSGAL